MRQLYIKQKALSLSGKFSVKDELENKVYFVEGSFMKIPKTFSITNTARQEVAMIRQKVFSFLPTFFVDVHGQKKMTIKRELTFLKARYTIDAARIEVRGNLRDMDFQEYQNRKLIGTVSKKWFKWGDCYQLKIADNEMEPLLVALVVAIDCAKAARVAAAPFAGG
ncbi:LURP-one-related/scramblase family protein [Sporosarcina sp. NPDC096371]|uniref:LURP-one-related/scramblase family protein n=1 Tax=Sporosarcina sp. NPDC096371 TaxID=3364530 RepID=UPI0037F58AC3